MLLTGSKSYYDDYLRKKGSGRTLHDPASLLTDRGAYVNFLEVQLERVSAACLSVQAYEERFSDVSMMLRTVDQKCMANTKLIALAQQCTEEIRCETDKKFEAHLHQLQEAKRDLRRLVDSLDLRLSNVERQVSTLSSLEQRITQLEKRAEENEEVHRKHVDQVGGRFQEHSGHIFELRAAIQDASDRTDSMHTQQHRLRFDLEEARTSLSEQIVAARTQISSAVEASERSAQESLQAVETSLSVRVDHAHRMVETSTLDTIAAMNRHYQSLQTEMELARGHWQESLDDLEARLAQAVADQDAKSSRHACALEELSASNSECRDALGELQQEAEERMRGVEDLYTDLCRQLQGLHRQKTVEVEEADTEESDEEDDDSDGPADGEASDRALDGRAACLEGDVAASSSSAATQATGTRPPLGRRVSYRGRDEVREFYPEPPESSPSLTGTPPAASRCGLKATSSSLSMDGWNDEDIDAVPVDEATLFGEVVGSSIRRPSQVSVTNVKQDQAVTTKRSALALQRIAEANASSSILPRRASASAASSPASLGSQPSRRRMSAAELTAPGARAGSRLAMSEPLPRKASLANSATGEPFQRKGSVSASRASMRSLDAAKTLPHSASSLSRSNTRLSGIFEPAEPESPARKASRASLNTVTDVSSSIGRKASMRDATETSGTVSRKASMRDAVETSGTVSRKASMRDAAETSGTVSRKASMRDAVETSGTVSRKASMRDAAEAAGTDPFQQQMLRFMQQYEVDQRDLRDRLEHLPTTTAPAPTAGRSLVRRAATASEPVRRPSTGVAIAKAATKTSAKELKGPKRSSTPPIRSNSVLLRLTTSAEHRATVAPQQSLDLSKDSFPEYLRRYIPPADDKPAWRVRTFSPGRPGAVEESARVKDCGVGDFPVLDWKDGHVEEGAQTVDGLDTESVATSATSLSKRSQGAT